MYIFPMFRGGPIPRSHEARGPRATWTSKSQSRSGASRWSSPRHGKNGGVQGGSLRIDGWFGMENPIQMMENPLEMVSWNGGTPIAWWFISWKIHENLTEKYGWVFNNHMFFPNVVFLGCLSTWLFVADTIITDNNRFSKRRVLLGRVKRRIDIWGSFI